MLARAREVRRTEVSATRLQSAQFSSWIIGGETADDAFKLLQLHRGDDNIFARPEFRSWVEFLIRRGGESPVDVMHVAMMHSLHAHYSDEALAKMVFAAKEVPRTRETATTLQNSLFSEWKSQTKTGAELFKLFQLDEAGDEISRSRAFSNSASYVSELETKRSMNVVLRDTFPLLLKQYEEPGLAKLLTAAKQGGADRKVISNLQRRQFKKWQEQGETEKSVTARLFAISADGRNADVVADYHNFLGGIKA